LEVLKGSFQKPNKEEKKMKDKKRLMEVSLWVLMVCLVGVMASGVQAGEYSIGAGIGVTPDYEGSSDYKAVPIPFGEAKFDNGMFVRLQGLNLRANLLPGDTWRLGPVYNYRPSRSHVDNDKVDDLKNISDANELGAFGGFNSNNWFVDLEFLADTGNAHEGWYSTLKVGYNWIISDPWILTIGGHGTYADGDYMSTYFGIDGADAARSGLDTYNADAGIKDIGLDIGVDWKFWEGLSARGIVSISQLVEDADDSSPVTDEGSETQFFGGVLVIYKF
jgi:outer membrane scaffolding protein for murein synthesis (MipA/OmpV family)